MTPTHDDSTLHHHDDSTLHHHEPKSATAVMFGDLDLSTSAKSNVLMLLDMLLEPGISPSESRSWDQTLTQRTPNSLLYVGSNE